MKIHFIRIRRIREIESLDIDCGNRAMIAIVGENGSGKTTVFFSLLFALTGVLTLKGRKEEHVRDVGDGPAWVEVDAEVNGKRFVVRRSMNSATCTLKVGDEKPIKGSTKVNAWFVEQGLDPGRIQQAFLPQGDADALFQASDGERATASLRIFGMSDIECYDESLKRAAEPLLQRIDNTLDDRLEEAQAQYKIACQQLEKADERMNKAVENRNILTDAEAVIRQEEARRAADSKRSEILALRDRDAEDREQLSAEKASENEQRELLQRQVAETQDAYDQAKALIYADDQWNKTAAQREDLARQLHDAQKAHEGLLVELEDCQAMEVVQRGIDDTKMRLTLLHSRENAARALQAACGRHREAKDRLDAASAQRATLEAEKAALVAIDELQADRQAFAGQLAVLEHQRMHAKGGRCGTCGQTWGGALPPEQLAQQVSELEQVIDQVDQQVARHTALDRQLHQVSVTATAAQADMETAEQDITTALSSTGINDGDTPEMYRQEIVTAERMLAEAEASRDRLTHVEHQLQLASQQVTNLQKQLESLQGKEIPMHEVAEAEQFAQAFEEQKQRLQATALRHDMLAKRISDIDGRLRGYEAELERIRDLAEGESMGADVVNQARGIIEDGQAIHAEYDAAIAEHAGIKREFEMFDAMVTRLTADLKQQGVDRKKLEVLRGARFILHREQLPRFICSYYTEIVSQQWAEELERFGAKFTAWQDPENLEFYARFENGNERRVYQLSGGERQLAIVAYLRVINRLFAPDLGILGFDEPTTHVDERFRPVIAEVFRRMATQADEEGLQVFVVDHAPEFLAAIPAAIKLKKSA